MILPDRTGLIMDQVDRLLTDDTASATPVSNAILSECNRILCSSSTNVRRLRLFSGPRYRSMAQYDAPFNGIGLV